MPCIEKDTKLAPGRLPLAATMRRRWQSLETSPGWRHAERTLLTLGLALLWVVGYFAVGLSRDSAQAFDLNTPFDDLIPFAAASIWIYVWVFPAALMPLFVVRCPRLFRLTAAAYGITIAVSLVCFALLPVTSQRLRAPRSALDPGQASDWLVALVYAVDPPYNLFPSLHLSIAALAALSVWSASRRYGVIAFVAVILVGVSVCTAKQHFVLDVLGGLAIGTLVGAALLGRYRPESAVSPAYSWRGPALYVALVTVIYAALYAGCRLLDASHLGVFPQSALPGA